MRNIFLGFESALFKWPLVDFSFETTDAEEEQTTTEEVDQATHEVVSSSALTTASLIPLAVAVSDPTGTDGDDYIVVSDATEGQDLQGLGGMDTLVGSAWDDVVDGGAGRDTLFGGDGADTILGGSGFDMIEGGDGADTVRGGNGNDTVVSGGGADTVHGGNGKDEIEGGSGADWIKGGGQADLISAGNGDDTVLGEAGADKVNLGNGDDLFLDSTQGGGNGSDQVKGGAGNDTLESRGGSDTLVGGEGADIFRIGGQSLFLEPGHDGETLVITDFTAGLDVLDLDGLELTLSTLEDLAGLGDLEGFTLTEDADGLRITYTEDAQSLDILLEDVGLPETTDEMMIVLSTGQSLSTGSSHSSNRALYFSDPVAEDQAFMLDFGSNDIPSSRGWGNNPVDIDSFVGLEDLHESSSETHASGMVAQLLAGYADDGLEAPSLTHIQAGVGGTSMLRLMTSADDIYSDLDAGLAATAIGDIFAVEAGDTAYAYYVNDGAGGQYYTTFSNGTPVFDTLTDQLTLAVQAAQEGGYALQDTLAVALIHGQSDQAFWRLDTYGYDYMVETYLARIDALADSLYGIDVSLVVTISQIGGTSNSGLYQRQLDLIANNDNIYLGAVESQFEASYPNLPGSDYVHLTPEGYTLLGQTMGVRLYDALSGEADDPILIDTVTRSATDSLVVTFSGVEGTLVSDTSAFLAENGFNAPDAFGFQLYDSNGQRDDDTPSILSAVITGTSEITLVFDDDLTGDWQLYLGKTGADLSNGLYSDVDLDDYLATTLRDSEIDTVIDPTDTIEETEIYEFAPTQSVDLSLDPLM